MDEFIELFRRVPGHVQDGITLLFDEPVLLLSATLGLATVIAVARYVRRNR